MNQNEGFSQSSSKSFVSSVTEVGSVSSLPSSSDSITQSIIGPILKVFEATFACYTEKCHYQLDENYREEITLQLALLRQIFTLDDINKICNLFISLLREEPSILYLNEAYSDYYCFGDLHGSLSDLIYIRHTFWENPQMLEKSHYVFLGDYVDRGIHGFEVVMYLIMIKLVYPNHFTILRGNHEVSYMNKYSFLPELICKFGNQKGKRIWYKLNECFSMLPYAALINNDIFCCHGGIPKQMKSFTEIEKIPKGLDDCDDDPLAFQLLWNDFFTKEEKDDETNRRHICAKYFVKNWVRNAGFFVGPKAVEQFLSRHQLKYIIRAHQYNLCSEKGYNFMETKNGAVLTLFSNSSYTYGPGHVNSTAYVRISLDQHKVGVYSLVSSDDTDFFNQSEIFESNDEIREMKYRDPFE